MNFRLFGIIVIVYLIFDNNVKNKFLFLQLF